MTDHCPTIQILNELFKMTGLTSATLAPVVADGNFFPMVVFYPMEAIT